MTAYSIHIQEQKRHLVFSANTSVAHSQPLQIPGKCCSRGSLCQGSHTAGYRDCYGTDGSWASTVKTPAPGPAVLMHRVFLDLHLGQRNKNQFPVSRPPWICGLSCFIVIWHLIWRPDLGNSCYSSSGLSTINHVRRQQCYLQLEILQLVAGVCRNSPWTCLPRKGLHLPV